jgi:hypothetical protein
LILHPIKYFDVYICERGRRSVNRKNMFNAEQGRQVHKVK